MKRWMRCMSRQRILTSFCELAVKKIIELARQEETLCYAVSEPQNDATVRLLAQKLPEDVELCVLSGMTLADAAACAVIPFGVNTENLRTLTALPRWICACRRISRR